MLDNRSLVGSFVDLLVLLTYLKFLYLKYNYLILKLSIALPSLQILQRMKLLILISCRLHFYVIILWWVGHYYRAISFIWRVLCKQRFLQFAVNNVHRFLVRPFCWVPVRYNRIFSCLAQWALLRGRHCPCSEDWITPLDALLLFILKWLFVTFPSAVIASARILSLSLSLTQTHHRSSGPATTMPPNCWLTISCSVYNSLFISWSTMSTGDLLVRTSLLSRVTD